MTESVPPPSPPSPPPGAAAYRCVDCGTPLNPHSAKYRGVRRCRRCAQRKRQREHPSASRFDRHPERARAAVAALERKRAEERKLADLAREHGLDRLLREREQVEDHTS